MSTQCHQLRCFIVLIGLLIGTVGLSEPLTKSQIAEVESEIISTKQYVTAVKALGADGMNVNNNSDLRRKFVDHLVNSKLMALKAKKDGFDKDPQFAARLKEVTEQLLAGEYMDRLIAKEMTDKNIRAYFDANKQDFSDKEIHAKHILVSTENEGIEIIKVLEKNLGKFDELASQKTKDPTIDLGFFKRGRMVRPFEEVAFSLKKGELAKKPVHTPFGWHVIFVVDSKGNDQVDFNKTRKDVEYRYRQIAQEKLLRSLRDQAKVQLNSELIKAPINLAE